MPTLTEDGAFTFVSYDGSKLPKDPNVRAQIRRRAMRHTATIRKQAGGYGRHNPSQFDILLLGPVGHTKDLNSNDSALPNNTVHVRQRKDTVISRIAARTRAMSDHKASWRTALCPSPECPFVTAMSRNYYLLNLASPLTVLRLGVSTLSYFYPDYSCIGETLSKMPPHIRSRRLLSFIPSRYGHVPSITHATDCLIARLGHIIQSGGKLSARRDLATLKSYARALKSLQEAIDDEKLRITPETLCAAEILGLFELLNGESDIDTWMYHAGGAAQLIELRGPDQFQSDFELSLFIAHTGPIVTEAFLNGKSCFLEEERWQRVIQAAVVNDPLVTKDQTHLVIKLWESLGKGPNLFKQAAELISHPSAPENAREDFIQRLLGEQIHLKTWLSLAEQYQYGQGHDRQLTLNHPAANLLRSYKMGEASSEQRITWKVLQGTYLLCCLVKTRLLFAMAPSRFPELESICQSLAQEAMSVAAQSNRDEKNRLIGGLFMSEIGWVAKSVVETADIWMDSLPESNTDQRDNGMIEQWRFDEWCIAMRRNL